MTTMGYAGVLLNGPVSRSAARTGNLWQKKLAYKGCQKKPWSKRLATTGNLHHEA